MHAINKQQFHNLSIFIASFLFVLLITWAVSGGSPRLHDILLFWVLWNCLWFKPLIFKIFSPLILLWLIYAPVGFQYGYPSSGMVASFFETTANEAKEFFDTITITYTIITLVLSFFAYFLTKKVKPSNKQVKFFKYFSYFIIILFVANIVSLKDKRIRLSYSELLDIIPHTIKQYHFYLVNKQKMQQLERLSDDWKVHTHNPTYQNYVLIIGESASKNFLSAYGYPVNTSPFLNKVNGTQYQNAISPAIFTIKSVPRLLTIPNREQVEYQNNIIHLANKLQMPTYWISNQDKMGEWDNEISYIASYAKEKYYLSEKEATSARFDYQLLPKIKEVIQTPSHKPKLIIVHLMGSHVQFKKRVDFNKAHFNFKNKLLSDYLSSLLQTDMLLEDIHTELKNSNQPFSMVYIADHAIMPKNLKHGMSQFTLQVPLFKISSDSQEKQTDDRFITGFGFVWFLTEWLGIDTKNQSENAFLNNYYVNHENELMIFEEKVMPYLSVEPFDGKILLPEEQELAQPTSK